MAVKIGIIGAMNEEIELLHKQAVNERVIEKAGIVLHEGLLRGKPVVYGKSGVGKVNAAVCTQVLIDQGVDCIWFTGVAGALDPQLEIGDIVISTSSAQHDMDVSPLGFERGVIPFQQLSDFPADARLVEIAVQAAEQLFPGRYRKGRVLSGDQFIASRETVRQLHEEMHGVCTEMEGAALAQVCAMNGIPYVVIRSISDKADGSAHVNFPEFTVKAAENSYRMIEEMIARV
ncbi:5'-methylthioadenosine/adenosylhomocysteine nucleosidase [Paenibacillus sp. 1P07SE]|uniref:5'-methylthioadenosine/adenosylhomocysteine nucleosidase n=1 Tax=Paenibacillus sp. 1P07SE TaxID=3132209 RepID=UPI0039A667A9